METQDFFLYTHFLNQSINDDELKNRFVFEMIMNLHSFGDSSEIDDDEIIDFFYEKYINLKKEDCPKFDYSSKNNLTSNIIQKLVELNMLNKDLFKFIILLYRDKIKNKSVETVESSETSEFSQNSDSN